MFDATKGNPRTDAEFRNYLDRNHHLGKTILTENPLITDMIYSFPIDIMHALDLGVSKKILKLFFERNILNKDMADQFILAVLKYVPVEFARKPRLVKNIDHYKAAEWRTITLYLLVVLLRVCEVDEAIYELFLKYFIAYRLLLGEEGIITVDACNLAESLLQDFVIDFKHTFGELSFNFHSLLHLAEVARVHGPLDKYSAYKYENWYQLLRKWIRKPNDLFKQIYTRWLQSRGMVSRKSTNPKQFDRVTFNKSIKNNCVMSKDGDILLITRKILTLDGVSFEVQKFSQRSSMFYLPIDSAELNIFVVCEDSLVPSDPIQIDDIKRKMFRIPFLYERNFVVMPILHSQ